MDRKILIADDDEFNREMIKALIKDFSCDIFEASNGIEALNIAMEVVPDLIFMDVMMPGKNGYKVCRELKSDLKTKDIYITFLTARDNQQAQKTAMDAGGDKYLVKPIRAKDLREAVKTAFEG
jgi:CheY-like chemotaxis protein